MHRIGGFKIVIYSKVSRRAKRPAYKFNAKNCAYDYLNIPIKYIKWSILILMTICLLLDIYFGVLIYAEYANGVSW
ncbi:hypothetical protein CK910_06855 [Aeromonas sp. CA23]|nr:hypothetical protein CK910_06855 [Aeromonas sp. CA23]